MGTRIRRRRPHYIFMLYDKEWAMGIGTLFRCLLPELVLHPVN